MQRGFLRSIGHFVVTMAFAFAAERWDLDRLCSRFPLSEVAGLVLNLLMLPHAAAMRTLPNSWLI